MLTPKRLVQRARSAMAVLVLLGLAGGLVAASLQAYQGTLHQQKATLLTHMLEQTNRFVHQSMVDGAQRDPDRHRMIQRPAEEGYDAFVTNAAGRVLVATDPAWEDTPRLEALLRRLGSPQPVTLAETHTDGDYMTCLRLPPERRGPPPRGAGDSSMHTEHRPGSPTHPQWYCLEIAATQELAEVQGARAQLIFSILGALALLGLGVGVGLGQRREARLHLQLERRKHLAALGQLGATLAHEVRTPLAAIRGFAQLLLERSEGESRRLQRPSEKIVEETDRLGRLVDDLLSYAQPAPPRFAEIDLAALVQRVAERLVPLAAEAGARLLCEAPETCPATLDPDRMTQLLDNLTRNALAYTEAGGVVLLRLHARGDRLTLEVCDRGPGVPEDQREAIFAPFYTTRSSGTGLGLAVCRRIAEEHGGSLIVTPREGGGACFHAALPRRPTP